MEAFRNVLHWLVKLVRLIGGVAVAGMMFFTMADIILRTFDYPIFGSFDITQFLTVIALAASLMYTHVERGHVGVDLLAQKLSPRSQATLDSITSLVSLVLFAIVAWQMWLYAGELATKGEVSMTILIPKHPFIYGVSICFGLFCLAILDDLIRSVGKAVKA
jgi:TRAP-type C4-dicarboxylate transport system permease small subunit